MTNFGIEIFDVDLDLLMEVPKNQQFIIHVGKIKQYAKISIERAVVECGHSLHLVQKVKK